MKKLTAILISVFCSLVFCVSPLIGCTPASPSETEYEIVDANTYDWNSFNSPFEQMTLDYDEPKADDVKMNIAVLSDIHLQTRDDHAERNFKKAVDTCVEMSGGKLDSVAIVGDLLDSLWWDTVNYSDDGDRQKKETQSNSHRTPEVAYLRSVFDKVIPQTSSLMFTIGNHDLCTFSGRYGVTTSSDQKIVEELKLVKEGSINRDYFEYLQDGDEGEYMDSQPASVQLREGFRYYRQNGVNFVILNANKFYSATNCYTDGKLNWLKRVLNYIRANHSGEPVLVFTHQPVNGSVLGSVDESHSLTLEPVLKDYPEVILFTGHIHCSNYSEMAITQELGFTVVEASSTKYTSNSLYKEGKNFNVFNGSDSSSSSQGLLVRVMKDNTIRIARIDFSKQRKTGKDWVIAPLKSENNKWTFTQEYRDKHNTAPYFEDAKVAIEFNPNLNPTKAYNGNYLTLKFSPAVDKETIVNVYAIKTYDANGEVIDDFTLDSGASAGKPMKMYAVSFDEPELIEKIEIYAEDAYYKRSLPIVIHKKDFGDKQVTRIQPQSYIGTSNKTGNLTVNGIEYLKSDVFVETDGVLNNYNSALHIGSSYFDAFASSYAFAFDVSKMYISTAATTHGDASSEYRLGVNLATFEQDGLVYSFNGVFDWGTYNSTTRTRTNTNRFYYYLLVSGPSVKTASRQYSLNGYGLTTKALPTEIDVKDILKSETGGTVSVIRNGSVFTISLNDTIIDTVDLKGDYYVGYNLVSFTEDTKATFGIATKGAEATYTNLQFTAQ